MTKYIGPGCPEGRVEKRKGGVAIHFERKFKEPAERLWGALTEPQNLSLWLGEVEMDLRLGGKVEIRSGAIFQVNGEITDLKQGSVLEMTWSSRDIPASLVRWEIFPEGDSGCRLELTHTLVGEVAVSICSGWHVHLGLLADLMKEVPETFAWPGEEWEDWNRYYAAQIAE